MRPLSRKLAGQAMNMTKKIRRLLGKSKHLLFSRNLDAGAPEAVARKERGDQLEEEGGEKVVENGRKGSRRRKRRRRRERTGEGSTVRHFTRCIYRVFPVCLSKRYYNINRYMRNKKKRNCIIQFLVLSIRFIYIHCVQVY